MKTKQTAWMGNMDTTDTNNSSRKRILDSLAHKEPDKIPLDLGGTESSGISGIAYNKLRDFLGLKPDGTKIFDVFQQISLIGDDLRERLGIDTTPLVLEPLAWKKHTLPDGSPCHIPKRWNPEKTASGEMIVKNAEGITIAHMPEGGFYFESAHAPLKEAICHWDVYHFTDEIESFDRPYFADEPLEKTAERAKSLAETSGRAIVANLQLHLLAAGQALRGYEAFMTDLLIEKQLAHTLLTVLTDAYIAWSASYFERMAGTVDVVLLNDDLGMQSGPMLSPECYTEMIWPYQKRLFSHIREKSGAHILFHSCGSVHRFIPQLIEAGVDALNPVQVSAEGMDTAKLKREFGKDITFWGGGCDTQHILCRGTKQDIRDEVKRRIDDLAPGGGFVFTQVHNIQPDVPPENIMAMYEAFFDFR